MLYNAYIDDSADGDRKRVVVAGAIIGRKEDWKVLEGRWEKRLKGDELVYFKSSQCHSLRRQFHKFRAFGLEEGKRRAEQVESDLDCIIRTSPLMALGVTLSVPFHQTMLSDPKTFGEVPDVPYRLAFQQVLAECANAMILLGRNHIVTFGHDDGDDFPILRVLYNEFKKRNKRYAQVMYDFVALDDKKHPPVQAADVAASVTCKFALNMLDDPTGQHLPRLRGNMYKIVNWLERPVQPIHGFDAESAPAKAIYAP